MTKSLEKVEKMKYRLADVKAVKEISSGRE
jgi:hypothetical protein